jgi:predicted RNA-binding Zn-ribbon protein involved in translation (DUF1610 family)
MPDESCPECGSSMTLFTEARQDNGCQWRAYDGDPVDCDECGFRAHVCADEDGAEVMWD